MDQLDYPKLRQLQTLARQTIDYAGQRGASASEVSVGSAVGFSVTSRMAQLEAVERERDRSLMVTVYFGNQKATASTSETTLTGGREAVDTAVQLAKHTGADEYTGLAPKERMATEFPELNLYHPWDISMQDAVDLALRCENAALRANKNVVNSDGAILATTSSAEIYSNSHGFLGMRRSTSHHLSCAVVAQDSSGMQTDSWYSAARAPEDLQSPEEIGYKAASRACSRLAPKPVGTRNEAVLFSPEVARSLIAHLLRAISGSAQYRQNSFLYDMLGAEVMPPWINVLERPHLPKGPGSRAFDAEGVQTADHGWVSAGRIHSYILDSYSARRLGMQTTGNAGGITNVRVLPGGDRSEEPLRALGRGLYVTDLIGQGVNEVTGDYSRGAIGFWVENGALVHPVDEVTIAGNLVKMLANVRTVGTDMDKRGRIQSGSILIDDMTIAGRGNA